MTDFRIALLEAVVEVIGGFGAPDRFRWVSGNQHMNSTLQLVRGGKPVGGRGKFWRKLKQGGKKFVPNRAVLAFETFESAPYRSIFIDAYDATRRFE